LQGDDFGSIARAAPVLRFVLAVCQPSLDVDLASLGEQALAVVRELPESNDSMPFGAFLLFAVPILESCLGCDREIRDVLP